ncbi:hypothetical protein SDC9_104830 [bioreactor metagenome]|uniref:Uncharacterized protein n=1 Tax=bioreactor metagenome TaxID=1076179 RepID=A0A645B0B2_9ZZZZ
MLVEIDSAALARLGAVMGNAAPAVAGDVISADGALIAGNVDDLNDTALAPVAAHGKLNPLAQNRPFLVYAAAHGGFFTGRDGFGYVSHGLQQGSVKSVAGHLAQHLVF